MSTLLIIVGCAVAFAALYATLRDREENPTGHGICPHCNSRYTRPIAGNVWECRQCLRRFHVEVQDHE